MSEVYVELETPFTTADTEGPVRITFSGEELTVTFANFRTPDQTIVFHNVRAFAWTGWGEASDQASPDRIYRVEGSPFLAEYRRFSVGPLPFIHFKLGFNAERKFLDVVATRMEHHQT